MRRIERGVMLIRGLLLMGSVMMVAMLTIPSSWSGKRSCGICVTWRVRMCNEESACGPYADYCVVRAIELRRWVVRASSVEASGFFSPLGERWILPMGCPQVAVRTIGCATVQTLYARLGDYWEVG